MDRALQGMQPRMALRQYARANDALAYGILFVDILVYFGCVAATILLDSLLLKSLFALAAGFFIAQLFVIGHDAGHAAYVRSRRANAIIARLCFMPSMHNYSLWQFIHNRLHHAFPNVKNYNSWSPLSHTEYRELPKWRQLLERLYRSPAGFGVYYLSERWLKDKLFPRKHTPHKYHRGAWLDFAVNVLYQVCLFGGVLILSHLSTHGALVSVVFAVFLPFLVWNTAMGLTVYQHHTHPKVQWYQTLVEARKASKTQSAVTVYVKYPDWYEFITHNIYIHPVHHVNARIPLYRLRAAQVEYSRRDSGAFLLEAFSLHGLLKTLRCCKLYDYTRHQWLDFNGEPTTPARSIATPAQSAEVIPLRQSSGNR